MMLFSPFAFYMDRLSEGDKDIFTFGDALDDQEWKEFIIAKAEEYSARKIS